MVSRRPSKQTKNQVSGKGLAQLGTARRGGDGRDCIASFPQLVSVTLEVTLGLVSAGYYAVHGRTVGILSARLFQKA